jgi:hypothetical protein
MPGHHHTQTRCLEFTFLKLQQKLIRIMRISIQPFQAFSGLDIPRQLENYSHPHADIPMVPLLRVPFDTTIRILKRIDS